MSDASALDIREQIARIDRNQAEINKLFAESVKLRSEARKFERDRIVQTALAFAAILGGALSVIQLLTHLKLG